MDKHPETNCADLYLDLMKKCLTRSIFKESVQLEDVMLKTHLIQPWLRPVYQFVSTVLASKNLALARREATDARLWQKGQEWPSGADTMIGLARLDNIEFCMREILRTGIEGDLIETGVWRGGAVIFMKAILKAFGDRTRRVFVADSFQGLPAPDAQKYPDDEGDWLFKIDFLRVSLEDVRANFRKYDLLDENVIFLKGWFKDTLPSAPIDKLALMRLDGDMYESTMDGLTNLYPKLSEGGFCIVDDYGSVAACKAAVSDYRKEMNIVSPLIQIDETGYYWKK